MQDVNQSYIDTQNLSEQKAGWGRLGVHTYIKLLILAAAVYSVFHTEIYSIVSRWINDSSWSHGFIIPLFSLYLLNQKKNELISLEPKTSYIGFLCLICCIAAYPLIVFVYTFGYFKSLLIIPAIGSLVLFIGGWKFIKYTWLPIVYLIFAIPLPS